MSQSIFEELFASLNVAILEYQSESTFTLCGTLPDWFCRFYPGMVTGDTVKPGESMQFLANFLVDAKDFWSGHESGQLKSGIWTEQPNGTSELHLEATAVSLGSRKLLLIEFPKLAYEEKQKIIQKGRETVLDQHRYLREVQKKEILLYCLANDLGEPLVGIRHTLEQLFRHRDLFSQMEQDSLDAALASVKMQRALVESLLQTFSNEARLVNRTESNALVSTNILQCAEDSIALIAEDYPQRKIELRVIPGRTPRNSWQVLAENSWLERVFLSLLDNGLKYSPPKSQVVVTLALDETTVGVSIDDEGPGVPPEIAKVLQESFPLESIAPPFAGVGLYYCHIAVHRWGGHLGYEPLASGGSRFWFRLPQV
ncbi:MAG: HAMP domain-containing histidine kinase [Blastocatellia bacterium]|nr:HAMP domain-containing histidine kinase [Blastocatellia bacterium]